MVAAAAWRNGEMVTGHGLNSPRIGSKVRNKPVCLIHILAVLTAGNIDEIAFGMPPDLFQFLFP